MRRRPPNPTTGLRGALVRLAALASRSFLKLPPAVLARLAPPDAGAGLDVQARVALATHARLGARPPHTRTVHAARRDMELAARLLAPPDAPGITTRDVVLATEHGPLAARVYRPAVAATSALPALVFYHGGGFVLGSLDSHDPLCRQLAYDSRGAVVAVDYRLAPEHPFPAAPDDAVAAFRTIARDANALGLDPRRLAVGGDSAGGTLAAVVALATRADPIRPMLQWLVYPAVDLTRSFPSIDRLGAGYFLERATLDWFARHYVPDPASQRDPRASPWYEPDLAGAPPAFVVTAAWDPLVDEGDAYASRLAAAGVPTIRHGHATLFHGFASATGGIAVARLAMRDAARVLIDAWRTTRT